MLGATLTTAATLIRDTAGAAVQDGAPTRPPASSPLTPAGLAGERADRTAGMPAPAVPSRTTGNADGGAASLAQSIIDPGDALARAGWLAGVVLLSFRSARRLVEHPRAPRRRRLAGARVVPGAAERAVGTHGHRAPGGDRFVCPPLGAGHPGSREAGHPAAGRRAVRAERGAGRSHPRARARPRPSSRLPGQPRADGRRDAALLSSRRLVGVASDARDARALLRRPRRRGLPQPPRVRQRPARAGRAPGLDAGAGARGGGWVAALTGATAARAGASATRHPRASPPV